VVIVTTFGLARHASPDTSVKLAARSAIVFGLSFSSGVEQAAVQRHAGVERLVVLSARPGSAAVEQLESLVEAVGLRR